MASPVRAFPVSASADNPFDLENEPAYRDWREGKLKHYPAGTDELFIEIGDPRALSRAEHTAILQCCRGANMAIYAGAIREEDKRIPRLLGAQFGLSRLDGNFLADEDGISRITVAEGGERQAYIPYTDRPIKMHTDGYYNPPDRRIRAMLLHCVESAVSGGETTLIDHEIAYLLMRDENPDFVRALSAGDAMTIPARTDAGGVARPAQTGPVFSVDAGGHLHMRYTARTRSIEWKADAVTRAAVAFLEAIPVADSPYVHRIRLAPGMGVICNNVLHDRSGFSDHAGHRRLLYRARYYDRIGAAPAAAPAAGGGPES